MLLYLIKYFFSNESVHALFVTLIHSLWQGTLVSFIAALILVCTKKSGAALRYKLLCGIFLLFIFLSLSTFCYEVSLNTHKNNETFKNIPAFAVNINAKNIYEYAGLSEKIIAAFQSQENFIILGWFIITMLKCISLVTGLRKIYFLKQRHVLNAGEYWNNKLKELARKAGVTIPVVLLKSAIIQIPMVIGHLKPIILFPASALTSLTSQEIESILLHELAHIRRKDYFVNILQSVAEMIFFFNPAVLWISSLIKGERENCCDDIAVEQVKNKKEFIHALVSFQEYNLATKYVASFAGNKNYLYNRIKRIITNNNKTLNNMEKSFLISGIIITCFAAVAFSKHKQVFSEGTAVVQPVNTFISIAKNDTVPPVKINNTESRNVINSSVDGKQYRLVEINGTTTELYVDNTRIPDNKIPVYKAIIEKLRAGKLHQTEMLEAQQETFAKQSELMNKNMVAVNEEMEKQADEIKFKAKEMQEKFMNDKMHYDTTLLKLQRVNLKHRQNIQRNKL